MPWHPRDGIFIKGFFLTSKSDIAKEFVFWFQSDTKKCYLGIERGESTKKKSFTSPNSILLFKH